MDTLSLIEEKMGNSFEPIGTRKKLFKQKTTSTETKVNNEYMGPRETEKLLHGKAHRHSDKVSAYRM